MRRVIVTLPEQLAERLDELARRERRIPKEQASLLLEDALRRRTRASVKEADR